MNTRSLSLLAAGAMVALVMVPGRATAQSASISATATVAGALSVTAGNNLAFGTVIPGFNRTILVSDAGAGTFSLTGGANAQVALSFTLPANLTSGANNLAVAFTGAYNVSNNVATSTAFTPSSGVTTRLDGTTGSLFVWLGGTLTVPAGAVAGAYSGTVTLNASYTGA